MQPRHIDELFKGTRLGTKIIFESRLKEWQNKNNINALPKYVQGDQEMASF